MMGGKKMTDNIKEAYDNYGAVSQEVMDAMDEYIGEAEFNSTDDSEEYTYINELYEILACLLDNEDTSMNKEEFDEALDAFLNL